MKSIGVISGKGGTGKTTVAYSLAWAFAQRGYKVAILDVDLTGPNITDILQNNELEVVNDRFIPSVQNGLKYLSLGQIASEGDPVLWNGTDLREAADQLFSRTEWGDIDYLVVDFPPGTGNEAQVLLPKMDYALAVTVPSVLSQSKARRMIEMLRETRTPILGIIINMSEFVCPSCGNSFKIFPDDHDFLDLGIPTIAKIPLNPKFAQQKLINDFPLDKVIEAMKRPIILPQRHKSLRRLAMELLFKRFR